MNFSGVTHSLRAKHIDPTMDEGLHEHTWVVTVFYPSEPFRDGRPIKAALRETLAALPDVLPENMWSGEAIAKAVLVIGNIVGSRVVRSEGYEAWAWK